MSAGHHRDGGYADAVVVPSARHLFPLDGLDPVRAAPLTDAALTSYRAIRRVLPWTAAGATAIVIGAGGLGQFAVQWLKLLGDSRVVVVDPADDKRERAAELGADEAIGAGAPLPPARAVVDFVGSAETMRLAADAVEPSGAVMSVGGGGGRLSFGLGAVPYESVFTTSSWGSRPELAEVLAHARRGDLRWEVESLPLDRVNDALATPPGRRRARPARDHAVGQGRPGNTSARSSSASYVDRRDVTRSLGMSCRTSSASRSTRTNAAA